MNPLVKILSYFVVVILCACVLSPVAYWACQWLIGHGWLSSIAGFPFHRYFSRVAQISALVLAWPFIRWVHIRSMAELGLQKNPRWWRDFLAGMNISAWPPILLAIAYLCLEIYGFKKDINGLRLFGIVGTAIVVAAMEEFFFRGVFLGLALRLTNRFTAIFSVSVFFAAIHFLKPEKSALAPDTVTWLSGFHQLATVFSAFANDTPFVIAGLVTLVFAGLILGYATACTRSLWLSIGIHATWIFGQQTLNLIAKFRIKPVDSLLPWVGPNQVSGAVPIGIWAVLSLMVTGGLLYVYLRNFRKNLSAL